MQSASADTFGKQPRKRLDFVVFNIVGSTADQATYHNELLPTTQTKQTFFTASFLWHCSPALATASSFTRFLDHSQRRATVGRTPLDE
jgi:hypothetical protein